MTVKMGIRLNGFGDPSKATNLQGEYDSKSYLKVKFSKAINWSIMWSRYQKLPSKNSFETKTPSV